jgi:hypothetical protein
VLHDAEGELNNMIYKMERIVINDGSHIIDLKDNEPTKGFLANGIPAQFKACSYLRKPPITITIEYKSRGDLILYGSYTNPEPNATSYDFVKKHRPEKHVIRSLGVIQHEFLYLSCESCEKVEFLINVRFADTVLEEN